MRMYQICVTSFMNGPLLTLLLIKGLNDINMYRQSSKVIAFNTFPFFQEISTLVLFSPLTIVKFKVNSNYNFF